MAKKWSCLGCLSAILVVSGAVSAADYHVNPNTGSMENDGSAQHPWRTLQEVIEANLVETQQWESLPYEEGAKLVSKNAGAPVKAGDTLWLHDGYHGDILIRGAYNADVITIAAASGQTPRIRGLHVQAGSNWVIRGLSISPEHGTTYEKGTMVFLESHGHQGPTHDVVVEDCSIFSVADVTGWTQANWNDLPGNAVRVTGNDCTIRNNQIRNVNFGITISGKHALVEYNKVDSFAGDGLRGLGDYGVFQYNTVKNCYDVNDNHDDGFQSWSLGSDGKVGQGEVVGIVLRGNTIINYEDPEQPFRGTLQGIGCFDGTFVDWVVENNVIITDHWHGITLMGARNSRIVNNTVIDLNDEKPGPPWVQISPHKDGTVSEGCVVRNNLTTAVSVLDGQDVQVDNNLIIKDPSEHFVDVSKFDLRLIASSSAIDTGSSDMAPAMDRNEIPRPQGSGIDIGAYEYYEGAPVIPDAGPDGSSGSGGAGGGSGGSPGTGGAGASPDGGTGGAGATADPSSEDDGGCGCSVVGVNTPRSFLLFFLSLGWLAIRRRAV